MISPVDLYVKGMVLSEAVELSVKSLSKLENLLEFKGYSKIYSAFLDSEELIEAQNPKLNKWIDSDMFPTCSETSLLNGLSLNPNILTRVYTLYKGLLCSKRPKKITMQTFNRLSKVFSSISKFGFFKPARQIQRIDIDIAYKKYLDYFGLFTFEVFIEAFEGLCLTFLYGASAKELGRNWEKYFESQGGFDE